MINKAFAPTGRLADCYVYPGRCPGLGAFGPSARVAPSFGIPDTTKGSICHPFVVAYRPLFYCFAAFPATAAPVFPATAVPVLSDSITGPMLLFYFAAIFIQHGSTFSAYLPVVRKTKCIAYQRIIGCRILYFECAGGYAWVGSGIIKPIVNTI